MPPMTSIRYKHPLLRRYSVFYSIGTATVVFIEEFPVAAVFDRRLTKDAWQGHMRAL